MRKRTNHHTLMKKMSTRVKILKQIQGSKVHRLRQSFAPDPVESHLADRKSNFVIRNISDKVDMIFSEKQRFQVMNLSLTVYRQTNRELMSQSEISLLT